jgi:hypothetical protein
VWWIGLLHSAGVWRWTGGTEAGTGLWASGEGSATAGEGLNFTLRPGMRAVSISVSEVVIAGGNLAPDNHVDVIGVFRIAQGGDVSGITGSPSQRPP